MDKAESSSPNRPSLDRQLFLHPAGRFDFRLTREVNDQAFQDHALTDRIGAQREVSLGNQADRPGTSVQLFAPVLSPRD